MRFLLSLFTGLSKGLKDSYGESPKGEATVQKEQIQYFKQQFHKPATCDLKPETHNPEPKTCNVEPETLNPEL